MRDVSPIPTEFNGTLYRSRTEARWAVFFHALDLDFTYEPEPIKLSSGCSYLPDFYIRDFAAFFEVKPDSEEIVTEECHKARALAHEQSGLNVWLAIGAPRSDVANILLLNRWPANFSMDRILLAPENRYRILEDRRDAQVYWLHSEQVDGSFNHSYMVGGPGISTDHDRFPILHNAVLKAYQQSTSAVWA